MVNVAREMERRGLDLPLLIGGATTSKQHTAVQDRARVLAADRARAGRVARRRRRLEPARQERRATLDAENRELQERLREQHAERDRKPLLPLDAARENRHRVAFDDLPTPSFTGRASVEPKLESSSTTSTGSSSSTRGS